MLTLDTINLLLAIDQGQLLDDIILTLIGSPQVVLLLEQFPALKKELMKRAPLMKPRLEQALRRSKVPPALASEFYLFQQNQLRAHLDFLAQLPDTLTRLAALSSPFYPEAQRLHQAASTETERPDNAFQTLFLQRWRISLTLQATTVQHQLLEREREFLLDELQQQLAMSGALAPLLAENQHAAGRLWDMAAGQVQQGDYRLLVHYGEFLHRQPELLQLAEQLGRSREARFVAAPHSLEREVEKRVREPAVQPEEISGIHQSDDLLRLLPGELSVLGIDELEYEFYRRLLEKRLLTYRLHGDAWRTRRILQPASSQQHEQQPRGPMIVCVDTSGSMGGFNEECAKGFCLALMRIALADDRRCFISLFSTGQVDYELTADGGLEQAIRFLGQRFRGGTDLAACLTALTDKLAEPAWQDADAVVISDFIAQRLPEAVQRRIREQQRDRQQRFHAVALSSMGKPGIMKIFDHIWRFDTGLKQRLMRRWRRKR
ncbi:ATPase RavA stimulator ViaA [Sodalis endosymbiont of Spalangia cameroni]|uniref:ATPase RavA stimulator ViaA n=1 Tax=Sodalis praecaptivus TaxID=1239307 RepID=UPI0031F92A0D